MSPDDSEQNGEGSESEGQSASDQGQSGGQAGAPEGGRSAGQVAGQTGGQGQTAAGQGGQTGGQTQPAGGQGQPAGGQAQPAGGQPQAGPGPGQASARGTPGESIGDIFSKPATLDQIKILVALYSAAALATGIAGFIAADTFGGGGMGSGFVALGTIGAIAIGGPLLSPALSFPVVQKLGGQEPDEQVFATVASGVAIGNVILVVIASFLTSAGAPGDIDFGDVFIVALIGAIGAAIAAAITGWALLNLDRR